MTKVCSYLIWNEGLNLESSESRAPSTEVETHSLGIIENAL